MEIILRKGICILETSELARAIVGSDNSTAPMYIYFIPIDCTYDDFQYCSTIGFTDACTSHYRRIVVQKKLAILHPTCVDLSIITLSSFLVLFYEALYSETIMSFQPRE